jgi:glycosyltransferase involved in cell wall biosynthesis
MPKLSIIIPTFNSSATIRRCLHSISSQVFTDYEVLIQDGGSRDSTVELIENFRKGNPESKIEIQQKRDKGVYDAMNKGIRRAKGEWIYFLGSDDELHDPNVLKQIVRSANETNCDVLYGNVRIVGDIGVAKSGTIYDGPFDLIKLLSKNICHQAVFYRSDCIKRVGVFNRNYTICSDWDFNMRCWSKGRFRYVDVTVANFYAGGLSTRCGCDERFISDITANVLKYFCLSDTDPAVNSPEFVGWRDLVKMRQRARKSGLTLKQLLRVRSLLKSVDYWRAEVVAWLEGL